MLWHDLSLERCYQSLSSHVARRTFAASQTVNISLWQASASAAFANKINTVWNLFVAHMPVYCMWCLPHRKLSLFNYLHHHGYELTLHYNIQCMIPAIKIAPALGSSLESWKDKLLVHFLVHCTHIAIVLWSKSTLIVASCRMHS